MSRVAVAACGTAFQGDPSVGSSPKHCYCVRNFPDPGVGIAAAVLAGCSAGFRLSDD